MNNANHKRRVKSAEDWRSPVECEYHDDISPETVKEIRKAAKAPGEDDPGWVVVDGPGW